MTDMTLWQTRPKPRTRGSRVSPPWGAADSLGALSQPLGRIIAAGALTSIPGIGDAIADIVTKLYETGTHPSLEKLRKEVPAGVLELFAIPGASSGQDPETS
jgi:DNA polymerase/3'-5' exonuclease PolX